MITLIKNGTVLEPEALGKKDVMTAGGTIEAIDDKISLSGIGFDTIDADGCYVVPGLIDSHVHICGGGGEGGYRTRTPEIKLTDITMAGITTIVGVLGTDGTTRTMSNLLAKAYGLEEEGVTTYVYTGSYQMPVRTVTGSITDDIILFPKIIGIGEIAVSDHRSSVPSVGEMARAVSEARIGGMLSGKAGVINMHMGDAKNPLNIIYAVLENSNIPITQFLPTHMNRNPWIFEDAVAYVKKGGYADFTTSTTPQFLEEGEVAAAKAVKRMLDSGVDISRMTISSDGQGSLPLFDAAGVLKGLTIGRSSSVMESIREMCFDENIPIEKAIKTATSNPASILKLNSKGHVDVGFDADLVVLRKDDMSIKDVICKGRVMVRDGAAVVKGTFEDI